MFLKIIVGLLAFAFAGYEIYKLVKVIKEKRQSKKEESNKDDSMNIEK